MANDFAVQLGAGLPSVLPQIGIRDIWIPDGVGSAVYIGVRVVTRRKVEAGVVAPLKVDISAGSKNCDVVNITVRWTKEPVVLVYLQGRGDFAVLIGVDEGKPKRIAVSDLPDAAKRCAQGILWTIRVKLLLKISGCQQPC